MIITTEDDPTPMVRAVATTLRRSAVEPKRESAMRKMRGTLVLRSQNDPQAVSIRFSRGTAHLVRGADTDAKVTISTDLAGMNELNAPKPRVTGALTHLAFALGAAKVLEPTKGSWQSEADRFWTYCLTRPGMPSGVKVVNTDDGTVHVLGAAPECEIHGSTHELVNVFMGNTFVAERAFLEKISVAGPLAYLARLTGAGIDFSMGL